jgi:hypothetical protein
VAVPYESSYSESTISEVVKKLGEVGKPEVSINIAGNGLYAFGGKTKAEIDGNVLRFFEALLSHPDMHVKIGDIRSGGGRPGATRPG